MIEKPELDRETLGHNGQDREKESPAIIFNQRASLPTEKKLPQKNNKDEQNGQSLVDNDHEEISEKKRGGDKKCHQPDE